MEEMKRLSSTVHDSTASAYFVCGNVSTSVHFEYPVAYSYGPNVCYVIENTYFQYIQRQSESKLVVSVVAPMLKIHHSVLSYLYDNHKHLDDYKSEELMMLAIDLPLHRTNDSSVRKITREILSLKHIDCITSSLSRPWQTLLHSSVSTLSVSLCDSPDRMETVDERRASILERCPVLPYLISSFSLSRHERLASSFHTKLPVLDEHGNTLKIIDIAAISRACLVQLIHSAVQHPAVVTVSVGHAPRFVNYDGSGVMQSGSPMHRPFHDMGLKGDGQVCGVADSGVNDVSCFFRDDSQLYSSPTTIRSFTLESERRKIIQYVPYADAVDNEGGHGTHTVGTLAGCSSPSSLFSDMDGVAPNAKVSFFDIGLTMLPYLMIPRMLHTVLPTAYASGARVHSNSWAGGSPMYGQYAYDIDAFLYEHQDFLVVLAAGNGGIRGIGSIGTPANAKNSLCVGSTQLRDQLEDSIMSKRTVSLTSSRGPTLDGRLKPDVLATGDFLMSAYSSSVNDQYNALHIRLVSDETKRGTLWSNLSSCAVHEMSGTSMATPVVAGAALLVRQFFMYPSFWASLCNVRDMWCKAFEPSGYLVKAVILHSGQAVSLSSDPALSRMKVSSQHLSLPPDMHQGYGAVDLAGVLPLSSGSGLPSPLQLTVFDRLNMVEHQTIIFNISLSHPILPIKITMAWFDPPSPVGRATRLLIHDLDLLLVAPDGTQHWGNRKTGGDDRNPNEQVNVEPICPIEDTCVYTCLVHAYSFPSRRLGSPPVISPEQRIGMVFTLNGDINGPEEYSEWPPDSPGSSDLPGDPEDVSHAGYMLSAEAVLSLYANQSLASAPVTLSSLSNAVLVRLQILKVVCNGHGCCSDVGGVTVRLLDSRGNTRIIVGELEEADNVMERDGLFCAWNFSDGELRMTDITLGAEGLLGGRTWIVTATRFYDGDSSNVDCSVSVLFNYSVIKSIEYSRKTVQNYEKNLDSSTNLSYAVSYGSNDTATKGSKKVDFPFILSIRDSQQLSSFQCDGTLHAVELQLSNVQQEQEAPSTGISGLDAYLLGLTITDPTGVSVVVGGGVRRRTVQDKFFYRSWPILWLVSTKWRAIRDVSAARLGERRKPIRGWWNVSLAGAKTGEARMYSGTVTLYFLPERSTTSIGTEDSFSMNIAETFVLIVVCLALAGILLLFCFRAFNIMTVTSDEGRRLIESGASFRNTRKCVVRDYRSIIV
eukprot:CAMPEP_0185042762 /NCGR_PEP_ID=MMETSP1103-20130426/42536_1 /TAXON_ID=36769 /ORGANISM="Paraphysomonas bandaiensis, Strain Caron Lab Isolate" /LENGTH=1211 /DNA_ID=CAMNT_0027582877 /DNA_START=327 /DNA_END=3962 /DNA_ORIENTATION=-